MTATLSPHFTVAPPVAEELASEYDAIDRLFDRATETEALLQAVGSWDAVRRRLRTWRALVNLRFRQDTRDADARAAREFADKLEPQIVARDVAIKRRLLAHPLRSDLEERFGAQAFRLWDADAKTYAPQIDELLVRESALEAEYTKLIGGITVVFQGRKMTLAEVRGFANAPDRAVRHEAERTRWAALAGVGPELDRIYAEMVDVRHRIGTALGHRDFIPVAYARMQRVDYDGGDVERWRDAVVRDIVPLAHKLVERSAQLHGYERLMAWDEAVLLDEDTTPAIDGPSLVRTLPETLGAVDERLGAFGRFMRDRDFLDVFAREGKGPGGFCTSFPTEGHPFIFASFNGTKDDVKVLVHEMGHAFQSYSSRDLALEDYLSATSESAEVHSMSLEFLAWPGLDGYFGPHANAFRTEHLAHAILFIPYGCAIDHYQHLVYARPEATPDERRAMWLEVQRRYLPWRDYGDVAYAARGNVWQGQLHVYTYPFYYIDYTLAQCCALQFWAQARSDRADAVARYVALCARGGSASFRELAASAGLQSPFDGGALRGVVEPVKRYLSEQGLLA